MYFVRKIDANGFFICDDFVNELTEFTILAPCVEPHIKHKWDGEKWVEGATQAEIDAVTSQSSATAPTLESLAEEVRAAMMAIMYLSIE